MSTVDIEDPKEILPLPERIVSTLPYMHGAKGTVIGKVCHPTYDILIKWDNKHWERESGTKAFARSWTTSITYEEV